MKIIKQEIKAVRLFTSDQVGHVILVQQDDLSEHMGDPEYKNIGMLTNPIFVQYREGIESLGLVLEERQKLRDQIVKMKEVQETRERDLQDIYNRDLRWLVRIVTGKKWWQFWKR